MKHGNKYLINTFGSNLKTASPEMDNEKKKNLKLLHDAGQSFVFENIEKLNEIVDKLLLHS